MFNTAQFQQYLSDYKENAKRTWGAERFKWIAVKHFQDTWDINAPDFHAMFIKATEKTGSLLSSYHFLPRKGVSDYSERYPERVRDLFRNLFDESEDVQRRVDSFIEGFDGMRRETPEFSEKKHDQNPNSVSTYLWMMYPDKYYIYKLTEYRNVSKALGCDYYPGSGKSTDLNRSFEMYDSIRAELLKDDDLRRFIEDNATGECYPDRDMITLMIDFGFYISNSMKAKGPPPDEHGPPVISKDQWIDLLGDEMVFTGSSIEALRELMLCGGSATCSRLGELYGHEPGHYIGIFNALNKRIGKTLDIDIPENKDTGKTEYYPIMFKGRYVENGRRFEWTVRDELREAFEESDPMGKESDENGGTIRNVILYGPPGTGKTFLAKRWAMAIIDGMSIEELESMDHGSRDKLIGTYDNERLLEHCRNGEIEVVTFHQSYSYESFIEGIMPTMDEESESSGLSYRLSNGVFKQFCTSTAIPTDHSTVPNDARVWKVSLESTGNNDTRTDCLDNGHIRIGFDDGGPDVPDEENYRGKAILNAFMNRMRIRDIVFSCYSESTIDAIGIVTGDYRWEPSYDRFRRVRDVEWIRRFKTPFDIRQYNDGYPMTLSTVYELSRISTQDVQEILGSGERRATPPKRKVFIIDEINRGNAAAIFGETLTLVEESKRKGGKDATSVMLPYSKTRFEIPSNIYIIGTMNTADRSLVTLDAALRRRFDFLECTADYDCLPEDVGGVDLRRMLRTINDRIRDRLDRDHEIGHSDLMGVKSVEDLARVFSRKLIPQLQDYFFDDFGMILEILSTGSGSSEFVEQTGDSRTSYSFRVPTEAEPYRRIYSYE